MATWLDSQLGGTEGRSAMRVSPSRILLIGRLMSPFALAAAAFLFRREIVDLIESQSGLGFVFTIVHLYSTAGVRLIIAVAAFFLFISVGIASLRYAPRGAGIALFAMLCAVLLASYLSLAGRSLRSGVEAGLLVGCLVAANAISPERWRALLAHSRLGRPLNLIFWIFIGIEFLLPRAYLTWIRQHRTGPGGVDQASASWLRILPSSALAAGALAALAPFPALMQLGQWLFMSPAATFVFGPEYQIYSRYDVSDLARSEATGDIFLCGQEQHSLKVLRGGRAPAADTGITKSGNEFCEFAGSGALATVDKRANELLIIDTSSLKLRGRLRLDRMPDGEQFLAAFPKLNLLAVASENEVPFSGGPAIRIVDLRRMKVTREIDAEVGHLIADPRRPVIYANHFTMNVGVRAWDMQTGRLLATSSRFGRSDRMAFDVARNELLATVPETGQIWRLDAATLKGKPAIDTVFGARGLAVDPARDLLLVSSFLTNELDVIDLKTRRSLRRYRLGPWLRDVLVVSDEGVAFVASRYGVYRLNYLH
jgi:hypothetical protein